MAYTTKRKRGSPIELSKVKQQLNIDEEDTGEDILINTLIGVAVDYVEKNANVEIRETEVTTEIYGFSSIVKLHSLPFKSIEEIKADGGTIENYSIEKYNTYTNLKFRDNINCDHLVIKYLSGSEEIPETLEHAIIMYACYLFDCDRNGTSPANTTFTKTIDYLINLNYTPQI